MNTSTCTALLRDVFSQGVAIYSSASAVSKAPTAIQSTPSPHFIVTSPSTEDAALKAVYTAVSSGKNVSLVLICKSKVASNRDLPLYALEYGGCFVASTGHEELNVRRALTEAGTFKGPSVVVISENPDVEFRWNPNNELKGMDNFCLDTTNIPESLQSFLDRTSHLTLLVNKHPELPEKYTQKLPEGHDILKAQLAKLKAGVAQKPLTVLYGSDGGNAEGLAKRFAKEAKRRGATGKVAPMDAFDPSQLVGEETVVFMVCTAGQGEFPGNAKKLWTSLTELDSARCLEGMNFAVFALGDRHYWPDPQFFCKSGRDLDERLAYLGASRLVDVGLGDDQDTDKYEEGYGKWEPGLWEALGLVKEGGAAEEEAADTGKHPSDEEIKVWSNYLRGTLKQTLDDRTTAQVPYEDTKVIKFHGIYQQDDRTYRSERAKLGIEPAYSFMARVRLPGGICQPHQWLKMDALSDSHGVGHLKVTTRQTFQLHGVLKKDLKSAVREMNKACMDTIAACGDVNRNVICTSIPGVCSPECYDHIQKVSKDLSDYCLPRTTAFHEIFLEEGDTEAMNSKKLVSGSFAASDTVEPIYGRTYLPRKFKVAVAIPPYNDVDVLAHCVGFVAIINPDGGALEGFTVTVGGGMGTTNGNAKTFPRVADDLCFCTPEQAKHMLATILTVQRDYGDRTDRKVARFKYTVHKYGVGFIRAEVEKRMGVRFEDPRPYQFTTRQDLYGWAQTTDGLWHYGIFLDMGRVIDTEHLKMKTALRHIAQEHKGVFRLTCNQGLIISDIPQEDKDKMQGLINMYGLQVDKLSAMRMNAVACVALPTCPLAFAESERYLPDLITKLEDILDETGLRRQEIVVRMTGCPNGCARPYLAEIGFVGRSPGYYTMWLGGDFLGHRTGRVYREAVNEEQILAELRPLLKDYSHERYEGESFGDYVLRRSDLKWELREGQELPAVGVKK
uniref:assimilatory sulfite reductase (NADPH) n=1 Tax=Chromera velia CCMP2878 TaxID=1169474 RepID=A0A0G4HCX5_9ALVE|mmetsp:Transcript_23150/g.45553  ORF Transcript_23150/g.45553 Transcript_23150/m.45553 type:complete len:955 (+) Transcript_23150:175-3039(+)|eukprot:Cvel_6332.t1-p1 / transcript=Cvel_6332.t1 / gene=Cvel_6332 / organism=Chromera_velia_CCMP2878 / gene_product=Sulfite reductase [NADPH] subunit beta, putative / transcript_product=Sulfite reductase [NADPH] subunit beta, putative / location=Cvel_scaffold307:57133-62682(-) / protein_length=954 / sequence_SO=supercontig / SO=protein_coding / is_pseudo=false